MIKLSGSLDTHSDTTQSESATESRVNISSLAPGAELFIWSARHWAAAARERQCVMRSLVGRYHESGCMPALHILDECMMLLAATAFRPVCIHAPDSEYLSNDEYMLVMVLQAVQRKQEDKARGFLSAMVAGRLNFTFRRAVHDYVHHLGKVNLSCTGVRSLKLVTSR